jgi:hypothetical protein
MACNAQRNFGRFGTRDATVAWLGAINLPGPQSRLTPPTGHTNDFALLFSTLSGDAPQPTRQQRRGCRNPTVYRECRARHPPSFRLGRDWNIPPPDPYADYFRDHTLSRRPDRAILRRGGNLRLLWLGGGSARPPNHAPQDGRCRPVSRRSPRGLPHPSGERARRLQHDDTEDHAIRREFRPRVPPASEGQCFDRVRLLPRVLADQLLRPRSSQTSGVTRSNAPPASAPTTSPARPGM